MKTKCMNPIIFIDELDVSHTEHGKEVIGVLIHLTDPQNEEFYDKLCRRSSRFVERTDYFFI